MQGGEKFYILDNFGASLVVLGIFLGYHTKITSETHLHVLAQLSL